MDKVAKKRLPDSWLRPSFLQLLLMEARVQRMKLVRLVYSLAGS